MLTRLVPASRNIMMSSVRRGGNLGPADIPEGWVGSNIPFKIKNRWGLTARFILFCAPPFWFPFFVVRYHTMKSSG